MESTSKNPPGSEEDSPRSWPSSASTSAHDQDQATYPQHAFETEPSYLPGPHDHSFQQGAAAAAGYGVSPDSIITSPGSSSSSRRRRAAAARTGPADDAAAKSCYEMPYWGHHHPLGPSAAAANVGHQAPLYRQPPPGDVTPYLGLRARLTQVPINRWTVLLLLILARVLILFGTLDTDLDDAQSEALSACHKVSNSAPVAVIFGPHELVCNPKEVVADTVGHCL